jgi:hypothetical protein
VDGQQTWPVAASPAGQFAEIGVGNFWHALLSIVLAGATAASADDFPFPPRGVPSCTSPASCAAATQHPFLPPTIQTAKDAISVARALELVEHAKAIAVGTSLQSIPQKDETFWQENFAASYSNGVWSVCSKRRYSESVGGLAVFLTAQDGDLMGVASMRDPNPSGSCPRLRTPMKAPVAPWSGPPHN